MSRVGQAKVLDNDELRHVLDAVKERRHPEKNTLILLISFKFGLRAQEMSLLRIKEVAKIGKEYPGGYELKKDMVLPASFTKGAHGSKAREKVKAQRARDLGIDTTEESKSAQEQKRSGVWYSLDDFESLVQRILSDGAAGKDIKAEDYYPKYKARTGGASRLFPLRDPEILSAIKDYLDVRVADEKQLKANDPLLKSQKGSFYSANTLQQHIGKILRAWSGIERASSHSGRRTLATNLLHQNKKPLATVQKILGHKDPSTTVIYHGVTDEDIGDALDEHAELLKR